MASYLDLDPEERIPNLEGSQRYATVEAAIQIIQQHGRQHGYAMITRRSKKTKDGSKVAVIYLECDRHTTSWETASASLREPKSRQDDCPFRICLRLRYEEDVYEIDI